MSYGPTYRGTTYVTSYADLGDSGGGGGSSGGSGGSGGTSSSTPNRNPCSPVALASVKTIITREEASSRLKVMISKPIDEGGPNTNNPYARPVC